MKSPENQLDDFIARYTPQIASSGRSVFVKLREIVPHALILVYDNYNALVIGFGPNERASDAIFSIVLYPKWISLFFLQGAHLPDPEGLLRGSGKIVRHLVLQSADDLEIPAIRLLISTALEQAGVPIHDSTESRVIIKSISEKQRPRRPAIRKGSVKKAAQPTASDTDTPTKSKKPTTSKPIKSKAKHAPRDSS